MSKLTDHVQCGIPTVWSSDFSQCLYEWQSLIGGILALFAAMMSVIFLRKQIAQSEKHHASELRRRHRAQRAVFSLTLSQICQASQQTLLRLAEIRGQAEIARVISAPQSPSLDLPDRLVEPLQGILETTEDDRLIRAVTALVTRIQVTRSRLEVMATDCDREVDERILDVAEVYAVSESMFDYARFEADELPTKLGWDRVAAALKFAQMHRDSFPSLHASIEKRSTTHSFFAVFE